jgi:hypothetical protein
MKSLPALLLCFFNLLPLFGDVLFDPPRLSLGPEGSGQFEGVVAITNLEEQDLSIDFMASAEGWGIEPSSLSLRGGEQGSIQIHSNDPPLDEAVVILMLSDREDVPSLYTIYPAGSITDDAHGQSNPVEEESFVFFYTPGCEICEEFYTEVLPALEEETGRVLQPEKLNVLEPGHYERLESLLQGQSRSVSDFPILIAGNSVYTGEREIKEDFPRYIRSHPEEDSFSAERVYPEASQALPDLRWLAVFMAGLLDGINPCAFTTLIFLVSYLRLLGKKGRDILKIGGSFTLAVFLTYFLVGLGAFKFIRMADSFSMISKIIKYLLGISLFLLSALSFIDFWRIKQGRTSQSFLQLSAKNKKRIHKVVRSSSRSAFVYLSSFAAGVLISVYELGCTGQIYLPMLVYMVKQEQWSALFPLALYNVAFILPLILVFALFYKGSDSGRIAELFQKHLGMIKITTAGLFLLMALFILFF